MIYTVRSRCGAKLDRVEVCDETAGADWYRDEASCPRPLTVNFLRPSSRRAVTRAPAACSTFPIPSLGSVASGAARTSTISGRMAGRSRPSARSIASAGWRSRPRTPTCGSAASRAAICRRRAAMHVSASSIATTPQWRETRDNGKFARMIEFGAQLPRLRRRLKQDLALPGLPKNKVLAAIVRLLDETLLRVGNEEYARSNKSYGLTTLRDRHVTFLRDGRAFFSFKGKSGRVQELVLDDRRLARIIRHCQQLPGQQLFQYVDDEGKRQPVDSGMVNDYLREAMGGNGEGFTAKDFRTWGATVRATRLPRLPRRRRARERAGLQSLCRIDREARRRGARQHAGRVPQVVYQSCRVRGVARKGRRTVRAAQAAVAFAAGEGGSRIAARAGGALISVHGHGCTHADRKTSLFARGDLGTGDPVRRGRGFDPAERRRIFHRRRARRVVRADPASALAHRSARSAAPRPQATARRRQGRSEKSASRRRR